MFPTQKKQPNCIKCWLRSYHAHVCIGGAQEYWNPVLSRYEGITFAMIIHNFLNIPALLGYPSRLEQKVQQHRMGKPRKREWEERRGGGIFCKHKRVGVYSTLPCSHAVRLESNTHTHTHTTRKISYEIMIEIKPSKDHCEASGRSTSFEPVNQLITQKSSSASWKACCIYCMSHDNTFEL